MRDPADRTEATTPLRQLSAFVAVAETGSISRAADRLGTTQPPLSRLILRLERHLGTVLVRRHSRGVSLTAAGTALLPAARRVLDAVTEFDRAAADVAAGHTSVLRVGTTEGAATLIRDTLHAYGRRHPDVEVRLNHAHTPAKLDMLRRGELDVAFVRNPTPVTGVRLHPLISEPLVAVLASDHPMAGRSTVELTDMAGYPFLLTPREINTAVHDAMLEQLSRAGFAPRIGPPMLNERDGLTQIAATHAWTLLAASAIHGARPSITLVPVAGAEISVTVSLAWPTNPTALASDFIHAAMTAASAHT